MVVMEKNNERVVLVGLWSEGDKITGFLATDHEARNAGIIQPTGETQTDEVSETIVEVYRPTNGWRVVGDGNNPFESIINLKKYFYKLEFITQ